MFFFIEIHAKKNIIISSFIRKAKVDAFKDEMSNDLQGKFDEIIVQKMGDLNIYLSRDKKKNDRKT